MSENLTPEQEAMLVRKRDEWIGYGLCTDPADRKEAEDAARLAYQLVNLTPPDRFIWVESLRDGLKVVAELLDTTERQALYEVCSGQHDAGWLAWTDAWQEIDSTLAPEAEGLRRLGKQVSWYWTLDEAVVLCDRPRAIHRDNNGDLHHETGPAYQYRDKTGEYFWHGVAVPQDLVEGKWTTDRILQEQNTEIARSAAEKYGWERFLTDAEVSLVSEEPDPGNSPYTLKLFDLPPGLYDNPVRLLLCTNGTPERDGTRHQYGLTVPASVESAVQAAAWTYNLTREEYLGAQRRT